MREKMWPEIRVDERELGGREMNLVAPTLHSLRHLKHFGDESSHLRYQVDEFQCRAGWIRNVHGKQINVCHL